MDKPNVNIPYGSYSSGWATVKYYPGRNEEHEVVFYDSMGTHIATLTWAQWNEFSHSITTALGLVDLV